MGRIGFQAESWGNWGLRRKSVLVTDGIFLVHVIVRLGGGIEIRARVLGICGCIGWVCTV